MDQYSPPTSFFKGPTDTDTPNQSEDVQTSKQAEILQEPRLSGFRKKSEVNQDISQLKAIAVYGIPENINNKAELKRRFEVYGSIVRIFPNPSKGTATIHFDNHTSAAQAKASVATFTDLPNADIKILWKQIPNKTRPKETAMNPSDSLAEKKVSAMTVVTRKEPAKYSPLDDSLIMRGSLEELYQFINIPAKSMSDKVALLDARDRIIRLKKEAQQKSTGTNRTKNLKGTCPDMCPEKERYSRCDKRRLAVYEMVETGGKDYEVDHRFAVKEYSRSSADQAEPLPHELRPLHVLEMTANYLFSTIVDRCDSPSENLGEWYNFLWDRTRGIRKDITQQSLCELGSVDLVEKCARLHIHCTARLCELDMQDFDQKINDENLTKCLQTLKHMYHDLSFKKIFCPNEAEFRSYDVLLHLNDGDTLRNVLQLREEIRDSPLVQTALTFFHTLNACNYVRFFKLAKENRHYLQCCLLQRYFNQIRNKALQIMAHAYGPPKKGQVPFLWMKDILGFENAEEACAWCDAHGLSVDVEKDLLLLDRRTFIEMPEKFPPIRRSFHLIESKRSGPLCQIIANGPINTNVLANHRPQNSFDLNGYLKKEALFEDENADESKGNLQEEPLSRPKDPKQHLIERLSALVFNEVIFSETHALTSSAVQEALRQHSRTKVVNVFIQTLWEDCLSEVSVEFFKGFYSEFRSAELQRRLEEQNRQYKRLKREEFTREVLNETLNSVLHKIVAEIVDDEINESIAQHRARLDRLTSAISTRLLHEILQSEVASIGNCVAREEITKREGLVRRASAVAQQHRLKKCIKKWAKFTKRKINLREEQRIFPACPSRLALEQQVSLLVSTGETRRSNKRKSLVDRSSKAKRISNLIDLQDHLLKIDHGFEQKRIDLYAMFEQLAKSNSCKVPVKAWQLSIVNLNCQNASALLQKWIGLAKNHVFSANGWSSKETRTLPSGAELSISVRYENDYQDNYDADALLLVFEPSKSITSLLESLSDDIKCEIVIGTLAIVQAENRSTYSIPSTLNSVWNAQVNVEDPNSLSFLQVHEVCANIIDRSFHNLLKKKPIETTLWDLGHRVVMKYVLPLIDRDLQERRLNRLPHRAFETLVNFHNERISEFLSLVELNEDRGIITSDFGTTIELMANYLILPNSGIEFASREDFLTYCRQVVVSELDPSSFMSRIVDIATKSSDHISKIPWTEIFQACLDYRLQAFMNKGNEVYVRFSFDFFECLKEAFGTGVCLGTFLIAKEEDIQEDLDIKTTPEKHLSTTLQSFSREIAIPPSIQALCERISLASSQTVEDTDFFEKSLSLPSLPPQKSPRVRQKTYESMTLKENLALLEEKIEHARRSDSQFECRLVEASRK